jgi:hypothetical protein
MGCSVQLWSRKIFNNNDVEIKTILDTLIPVVKDEQFVRPIIPTRP